MRQEGEIILDNSRIRIYELKYDLYDLVDKYKMRRVIFPNQNISQRHKQNITREAVNALLYGIPYTQVYVSELQNGQLLVLETDNRLRCLIEFIVERLMLEMPGSLLENKKNYEFYKNEGWLRFSDLTPRERHDILRTKIPICIIQYETPLYMHLKIGAYIGNWSVEMEEAVRRVLYENKGIFILRDALCGCKTPFRLMVEAEFVVFLTYIVNFVLDHSDDCEEDPYSMQENMLNYVRLNNFNVEKYAYIYTEARKYLTDSAFYYKYGSGRTPLFRIFLRKFSNMKPERGHILGMAACLCTDNYDIEELVEKAYWIMQRVCYRDYDGEIGIQLRNSDLSKRSIGQIIDELRRSV